MPAPEKPSPFKAFRKKLDAARKDRAFLMQRRQQERTARLQRRRYENARKAAEKKLTTSLLDLPGVWLEKQRTQKRRLAEKRQYASLGAAPPPLTPAARLGKAVRARLTRITQDRERLWRRLAGALGVVAIALLVCCVVIYSRYSPARPLVTIGNRVIQRREYQADLDAAAGKSVLTNLVFSELIRQAATKAGIMPTPAQIDARLAVIARRGMPLPASIDPAHLRERIGLTLALENLRVEGIAASDAEIEDFYRKNAAQLAQPAQVQTILVLTPTEFEAQTATGLLAKGATSHEVAAQPDMRVDGENGFHLNLNTLPDAQGQKVRDTALAMQAGQIMTLPLGNVFLTIKCIQKNPQVQPPLSEVRDQVALMVKLGKAPSESVELARLYQANRPKFDIERYNIYFDKLDHADLSK